MTYVYSVDAGIYSAVSFWAFDPDFPLNAENASRSPSDLSQQSNATTKTAKAQKYLQVRPRTSRTELDPVICYKIPKIPHSPALQTSVRCKKQPTQCPTHMPFSAAQKRHNPRRATRLNNTYQTYYHVGFTTMGHLILRSGIGHQRQMKQVRNASLTGVKPNCLNKRLILLGYYPDQTQTAHFRGRKLRGRRVALPEGYQGMKTARLRLFLNTGLSARTDLADSDPWTVIQVL